MPQGCEGEPNDMFIYKPWNLTQVMEACQVSSDTHAAQILSLVVCPHAKPLVTAGQVWCRASPTLDRAPVRWRAAALLVQHCLQQWQPWCDTYARLAHLCHASLA